MSHSAERFQRKALWLDELRQLELARLRPWLPPSGEILDFGAGPGYQARALAGMGFTVTAVDLDSTLRGADAVFPVVAYDGRSLPFPDASFDVVLSSNVLEHVDDLPCVLKELERVLRPGGTMLHVLPSATWRLWSTATEIISSLADASRGLVDGPSGVWSAMPRWRWSLSQLSIAANPLRLRAHGSHGNALSELWSFTRHSWRRKFSAAGLEVKTVAPLRLWYTGEIILGSRFSPRGRTRLARWAGSSTNLFVVQSRRR